MTKQDKILAREMRRDAEIDREVEDLLRRAPGHMTMRAVTELEHKRDQDNDFRFTITIFLLILSHLIEGPYWADLTAAVLATAVAAYWVAMSFYNCRQTKARVLTVLENHRKLQDEAVMGRH